MQRVNKNSRKNKHGSASIFMAIILSAIILVECTYMSLVADFNRRLAFNRAVQHEVETILADYDRELFRIYGIYAFDINKVDDSIFYKVLDANGIEEGDVLTVEGIYAFDTSDLKIAISQYYSYRSSGILFESVFTQLLNSIEEFDNLGILDSLKSFTKGKGGKYLGKILDGAKAVTDVLDNIAEYLDIDFLDEKLDFFKGVFKLAKSFISDEPDYTSGVSIENLTSVSKLMDKLYNFNEDKAELIRNNLFKPAIAHYAAYNFDSRLESDTTINGTSFEDIHGDNNADAEYLLTGYQGKKATNTVAAYIFPVVFILDFLKIYNDKGKMLLIEGASDILSVVISVISVGTVTLPPAVYSAVILTIYTLVTAYSDFEDILDGDTYEIVTVGNSFTIEMNYRDFLFIYMFFVSDNVILKRISDVLSRDYDGYCSSLEVTTSYRGNVLSTYQTYKLYS